ncbi:MAG: DUF5360 family protein [Pseudomonadota bacterium]
MLRQRLMFFTDMGMLLYWVITAAMALQLLNIPGEWLFKDYHDPRVVAWNWSFFPLDILFSVTGLAALRMERAGDPNWKLVATMSLTLTVCAGLMAISYWLILQDFDPSWWVPNLFLMIWPLPYLYRLARGQSI